MKEKRKKYIVKCHIRKDHFESLKLILRHENLTQQKLLSKLVWGYILDNASILVEERKKQEQEECNDYYDHSQYDYYYGAKYEDYLNGDSDDYY